MNVISYHTFTAEHRDKLGRRWCAVCGLPEQNARAKRLHAIPRQGDWRKRAWADERDEEIERAA